MGTMPQSGTFLLPRGTLLLLPYPILRRLPPISLTGLPPIRGLASASQSGALRGAGGGVGGAGRGHRGHRVKAVRQLAPRHVHPHLTKPPDFANSIFQLPICPSPGRGPPTDWQQAVNAGSMSDRALPDETIVYTNPNIWTGYTYNYTVHTLLTCLVIKKFTPKRCLQEILSTILRIRHLTSTCWPCWMLRNEKVPVH